MKIIKRVGNYGMFPMTITCKQVKDIYGFTYGEEKDFCGSILEVVEEDIKKHPWFKFPCYEGVDYGIVCPVCGKFVVVNKDILPVGVVNKAEEVKLSE